MSYTPTRLAAEEAPGTGEARAVEQKSPKRKRPRRKKPEKKKRWLLIPLILVVLLGVAAALAVAAYQGVLPVDRALLPDLNAKNGSLYADDPTADVPQGTYRFVVNQQPVMTAGENTCNLELENVPANHFDVQCSLTLEETGEELWTSNRLAPNKYVETVTLSRTFEPDEYGLKLHYRFFEGTEEISTQDINLTLYVQAAK